MDSFLAVKHLNDAQFEELISVQIFRKVHAWRKKFWQGIILCLENISDEDKSFLALAP
jgi:hypothetical protein